MCGGTARVCGWCVCVCVCVCVRTACEVLVCVCGQCMYVDPIHTTFQYSS